MRLAATDREAYLHVAGLFGLSPALRGGAPALVPGKDTAGRCGWEEFFLAVERARVALVWDAEDPGATALVPEGEARALAPSHSLASGLERAGRFLRALRGAKPP